MMPALRRRTFVFIGLSGDDANLDSLLVDVRDSHASLRENTAYWGVTFKKSPAQADPHWEPRGVFVKAVKDYDSDLPRILFAICQEAASSFIKSRGWELDEAVSPIVSSSRGAAKRLRPRRRM